MAVFATLVRLESKRVLRYPSGPLVSMLVDPLVVIVTVFMVRALYRNNGGADIVGYDLDRMIWYFIAATLTWYVVANETDWRISDRIMRGELAQDLVRPVSVITWELASAVATRLGGLLLEFLPSVALYCLIAFPSFLTPAGVAKFLVGAGMSFLLLFAMNFLIGLTSLYLHGPHLIMALRYVFLGVGAGAYIPLEFFPDVVQRVLQWTPFPYLFYWPIQFLLGGAGSASWDVFALKLGTAGVWAAALFAVASLMWRQAIRRYTDAGGAG